MRLVGEGKVALAKKGRVNVFYLRGGGRPVFKVPAWVKARGLKELSEELEEYLPEELGANVQAELRTDWTIGESFVYEHVAIILS